MNNENVEYALKMFNMNMEIKSLLYRASLDPINRRALIQEASEIIDSFYNLPRGMIGEDLK